MKTIAFLALTSTQKAYVDRRVYTLRRIRFMSKFNESDPLISPLARKTEVYKRLNRPFCYHNRPCNTLALSEGYALC
jgi:hypothetical protein